MSHRVNQETRRLVVRHQVAIVISELPNDRPLLLASTKTSRVVTRLVCQPNWKFFFEYFQKCVCVCVLSKCTNTTLPLHEVIVSDEPPYHPYLINCTCFYVPLTRLYHSIWVVYLKLCNRYFLVNRYM